MERGLNRMAARRRPVDAKVLWLLAAVACTAVLSWLPTPPGMAPDGQRALALLAGALILWLSEAVPAGVTGLLIAAGLLITQKETPAEEVLAGFASPPVFFLMGAIGLGMAAVESGLARRLASYVARKARGNPRRMYGQLVAALPLMPLALPSALSRNAVLLPVYQEILQGPGGISRNPSGGLRTAILLVLGILNPMASSMYLTGGLMPMMAATLLGGASWLQWLAWMGLPYGVLIGVGALIIARQAGLGRETVGERSAGAVANSGDGSDGARAAGGRDRQRVECACAAGSPAPREPAPWSVAEKKTAGVLVAILVLWLTDSWHHWHPALPALVGLVALGLPPHPLWTWETFRTRFPWESLLGLGSVLALADALRKTGGVAWFARGLLEWLGIGSLPDWMLYMLLAAVAMTVHLAVPHLIGTVSLMIPLTLEMAGALGLNPVAAGLLVTITLDSVVFYPQQTETNFMVYQYGGMQAVDVLRLGLWMAAAVLAAVPLIFLPYWSWIGLAP